MGWLVKKNTVWKLGAYLHYSVEKEYVMTSGKKQTKVQGLQGVHSSKKLWEINADGDLPKGNGCPWGVLT